MTVSNDAIRFPTSDTPHTNGLADYRDASVTRAAMQAHDAVDRVASSVGPLVDKVKDVAARAGDVFHRRDVRLSDVQQQAVSALRVVVRKRPATSVAVALALGWMVSRAISR